MLDSYEDCDVCKSPCKIKNNCYLVVIALLLPVLTLAIGLLIGAANAAVITAAMPAILVFIAILALIIISTLIFMWCNKCNRKC